MRLAERHPHRGQEGAAVVVLIDDHGLLAQSLALALQLEGVASHVAELSTPEALVGEVLALDPDLVLLDLDLGEFGDGSTLVEPLSRGRCRVVVVSASTDEDHICRALEAGAIGAINKSAAFTEVLDAILATTRGDDIMPAAERRCRLERARKRRHDRAVELAPLERLSARETEVLRALAGGHSVSVIARSWCTSEETVRSQVKAIRTKLGVGSQLEAVAMAHRSGWLGLEVNSAGA